MPELLPFHKLNIIGFTQWIRLKHMRTSGSDEVRLIKKYPYIISPLLLSFNVATIIIMVEYLELLTDEYPFPIHAFVIKGSIDHGFRLFNPGQSVNYLY